MLPFGPNEPSFRASLLRLAACRWLRPDAELEALAPAATAWLDDRLDELRAALHPFVRDGDPPPPLALAIERSARSAYLRWDAAWEAPRRPVSPVIGALASAASETELGLLRHFDRARCAELAREIRGALAATADAPSPWAAELLRHEEASRRDGRDVTPRTPGERHPAAHTAEQHLRWVVAFGDDAATPSPWAPIVAMFERGVWPVLLPDGTALVYVPVLRDGRLVPEPSMPGEKRRFPVRERRPTVLTAVFRAIDATGVSAPPGLVAYEPRMLIAGEVGTVGLEPVDLPTLPLPTPDNDAAG